MKKIIIGILVIVLIAGIGVFLYKKSNKTESLDNNAIANNTVETSSVNNQSIKEILKKVMNNEEKFVNENNEQTYLKEYKIVDNQYAKVNKYAYVDLDNDGIDELVILTTSDYGAYIILHYEDAKIYGYMLGIRSFESLKTDGTFIQSSGAADNSYSKISFNKNKYTTKNEAVNNETDGVYMLNGSNVEKSKVAEYVNNFDKKNNVEFVSL